MRGQWVSARSVLFHILLVVIVPSCLLGGWWQLHRALNGNTLSWAYTFEWPMFAAIACIGWWQLVHEDPADVEARKQERRRRAKPAGPPSSQPVALHSVDERPLDEGDAEAADALDSYNAYLATLAARGKAKTWRNPRGLP
jgi:hypothetical protein